MSEEKKEPGTSGAEHINIKVVSQDGNEIFFKVKKTTPFRKIFDAYCDRLGKSQNDIRFIFDGSRVNPDSTPEQLDMEDNDTIDAMVNQVGGCH